MITEEDRNQKDTYITMKCIDCGHEEEMPDWCYGEEASYLKEIGESDPPAWQCSKCHHDTLYKKGIKL